jgi:hypothetical protein
MFSALPLSITDILWCRFASAKLGNIHSISNGLGDVSSISTHLYGVYIGTVRRSVFDAQTGAVREFISEYSKTEELERKICLRVRGVHPRARLGRWQCRS